MGSIDQKKKIITDFLIKCNEYADGQKKKYRTQKEQAASMDALLIDSKIYQWNVYRTFNEYTIEELKTSELDPWFAEIGESEI